MTDDELTFPTTMGGETFTNGDTCTIDGKKEKAVLKAFVWPPQASEKVEPEVYTSDFRNIRFSQDQGIVALAFVPEGTKKIPLPPSIEALKDPLAAEGGGTQQPETPTESTVVPADGTATTVPPADASATTVPATPTTAASG